MKENMFNLEQLFMQILRSTVHDLKSVYNYTIKLDKYKNYVHTWWFWKYSIAVMFLLLVFTMWKQPQNKGKCQFIKTSSEMHANKLERSTPIWFAY